MKLNYLQKSIVIFYVIFIGVFLFKNHSNKEFYKNVVKDFANESYKKLDSLINPQYGVFTNAKFGFFNRKIEDSFIQFIKNSKDFFDYNLNPKLKNTLYSNLEFGEIKYIGNGKFQKDDSFFSNFNGQYLLDPNNELQGFALTGKDLENEERLKSITKYKISAICKDQSKNYEFYFGIENHKIYLCAVTVNPIMSDEGTELEKSFINSSGENAEYRNNLTAYINTSNFFGTPKLLTNLGFLDVTYSDKNIIIGNTVVNRNLESIHDNFIQYRINNQLKAIYLSDSINRNFQSGYYGQVFRINGSSKLLLMGGTRYPRLQFIDLENITDYGLNDKVFTKVFNEDTLSSYVFETVDWADFQFKQISGSQFRIKINENIYNIKWDGSKFIGDFTNIDEDRPNKKEHDELVNYLDTHKAELSKMDGTYVFIVQGISKGFSLKNGEGYLNLFGQTFIDFILKKESENKYDLILSGLEESNSMTENDLNKYSEEIPIASIAVVNDTLFTFHWFGLQNPTTKEIDWNGDPALNSGDYVLKKVHN